MASWAMNLNKHAFLTGRGGQRAISAVCESVTLSTTVTPPPKCESSVRAFGACVLCYTGAGGYLVLASQTALALALPPAALAPRVTPAARHISTRARTSERARIETPTHTAQVTVSAGAPS